MKQTKAGPLCAITACLLTPLSFGAASAQNDDPLKRGQTANPGGMRTATAAASIIDRSAMMTLLGRIQAGRHLEKMSVPKLIGAKNSGKLREDADSLRAQTSSFLENKSLEPSPDLQINNFRDFIRSDLRNDLQAKEILTTIVNLLDRVDVNVSDLIDADIRWAKLLEKKIKEYVYLKAEEEIFSINQQVRLVGKYNLFVTSLSYGNIKFRTDFAAHSLIGTNKGYGFAFHYDLVGFGYLPEDFEINPQIRQLIQERTRAKMEKDNHVYKPTDYRLAEYVLAPHAGLTADYRHLANIGDLYGIGISTSLLLPRVRGRESDGMVFGADLRYGWFAASHMGRSTEGVSFSASAAWQDRVPYFAAETQNGQLLESARLSRWHRRVGVEFAQGNAIVQGDYGAFFLRMRDRGRGEYTVLVGSEVNGQGFIGFNVATYFAR